MQRVLAVSLSALTMFIILGTTYSSYGAVHVCVVKQLDTC